MNKTRTSLLLRVTAAAALGLLFTACASAPSAKSAAVQPEEKVYQFEPWDGDGMDIPLDGSSLEAFETSMARVEAHTSPANYTTLENAIEYLLVYDLTVRRDKAKLAEKLDGKTPQQVLQMIQRRQPAPRESHAGDGAADGSLEL